MGRIALLSARPLADSTGAAQPDKKKRNLNLDFRLTTFDENALAGGKKCTNMLMFFSTFYRVVRRLRGAAQQHVGCASRWSWSINRMTSLVMWHQGWPSGCS